MGLIRTYLDAGVLIAAARAASALSRRALAVLDDPQREFVASQYLQFEILPKPRFHLATAELHFYDEFFGATSAVVGFDVADLQMAFENACKYGIAAFDAIHLTVANRAGCQEFVTTEKSSSPLFRFPGLTIRTID